LDPALDRNDFHVLVSAVAAGELGPEQRAQLEASPDRWAAALRELLDETEDALDRVARSDRTERDQAVADLAEERDRLAAALAHITGEEPEYGDSIDEDDDHPEEGDETADGDLEPSAPTLQSSWSKGLVVVWGGGRAARPVGADELQKLISQAGAAAIDWAPHNDVKLPTGGRAAALAAPLGAVLGWLVGVAAGQLGAEAAPSTRWLGDVTLWAAELVAQGRIVPKLVTAAEAGVASSKSRSRRKSNGPSSTAQYAVRWAPAVVDSRRMRQLVARMPGAVGVFDQALPAERVCRSVLEEAVHAVCRTGAGRLVAPATAPVARSYRDVAEAVMAGLDGSPFTAVRRPAGQLIQELGLWAAPVTGRRNVGLRVELHPPDREPSAAPGWLLTVSAIGVESRPVRYDRAQETASRKKTKHLDAEMRRLERLLPALRRSGEGQSQVVLDSEEAWDLMTDTGAALVAAGFTVRVPALSTRRPRPRLQLEAEPRGPSQVGAHQLSRVRWSVLFDDVELDAAEISRLAAEARPLVQVKGRWVELDRSDLDAASQVLAEHSGTTELSGAAIVRYAVGLEHDPLGAAGPVSVTGSGWAVDLVRRATTDPPEPLPAPEGFQGELRSYQAEARGWLAFLDHAGLGGCLAMDMGLGKTPTVLAHVLTTRTEAPVLVVAPAAVLGNWAVEAGRFTPDVRVRIHHGTSRAGADDLAAMLADTDLVLTTYATAVRDVDALAEVEWDRVILDEAQAIKNPASDTAQQLRRLSARSRLALTGTPVENSLGDLWSILDFTNPGLVGTRSSFVKQLSGNGNGNGSGNGSGGGAAAGEAALRALNGLLVFRRTKAEPAIAAELPDKIDELDHCGMTQEQIGLYQAILDDLLGEKLDVDDRSARRGHVLAAITALKQVCDHPAAFLADDTGPLAGRSGKLARLEELVDAVFAAGERMLIFTHFARWGERLAGYLSERSGVPIACYHGGLSRGVRDRLVSEFQEGTGPGALVLSIKAGGAGLNLTAANHVVLYDRWWNPAVEDQARDRAWRIGQTDTVVSHRLVCPGTIDERVEEVVAGKRRIADLVLPASSSLGDLGAEELTVALGLQRDAVIDTDEVPEQSDEGRAA
jgi:hypothetical protein